MLQKNKKYKIPTLDFSKIQYIIHHDVFYRIFYRSSAGHGYHQGPVKRLHLSPVTLPHAVSWPSVFKYTNHMILENEQTLIDADTLVFV